MTAFTMNKKHGGFTLIELSVVIVIIGLLTAALLNLYSIYNKQQQGITTADNLQAAQEALEAYRAKHGFYPCPADPADSGGKATDCAAAAPAGVIVTAGTGGQNVRIGAMPILDLSGEQKLIQKSEAFDGWRNRLTYAVTESLARNDGTETTGAITIVNGDGVVQSTSVAVLVLSHGDDGDGAYTAAGVKKICPTDKKDKENCDDNATFLSDKRSYAEGGEYTDDYMDFDTAESRDPLGPCVLFQARIDNIGSTNTGVKAFDRGRLLTYEQYKQEATLYVNELYYKMNGWGRYGYNETVSAPVDAVPVKSPAELEKYFDFKAVDTKMKKVACYDFPPSYHPHIPEKTDSDGGGMGGGDGGN